MCANFLNYMGQLLETTDFSDVTIVSDDQKIFKGHRNILSAFSPVLRNLFKVDSQYPSLLYLNGVNSTEINAIMQYIYSDKLPITWTEQLQSAVNSLQIESLREKVEKLNPSSFSGDLRADEVRKQNEDLVKVKFLVNPRIELRNTDTLITRKEISGDNIKVKPNSQYFKAKLSDLVKMKESQEMSNTDSSNEGTHERNHQETIGDNLEVKPNSRFFKAKLSDLVMMKKSQEMSNTDLGYEGTHERNYLITSKETIGDNLEVVPNSQSFEAKLSDMVKIKESQKIRARSKPRACDRCSPVVTFSSTYQWKKHNMTCHQESIFKCDMCDYSTFENSLLKYHIDSKHLGIKESTPCDKCDYDPKDRRNLAKHKQSVHEGVKFSCNYCEYQTGQKSSLKIHIRSVHEGIREQCSQCGRQFARAVSLYDHIKTVHEGIRLKCPFCEYLASKKTHLDYHVQKNHAQ